MQSFVNCFRQWQYLLLLCALLSLLVIQPIASSFGSMGSLFDVLLVFVLVMLVCDSTTACGQDCSHENYLEQGCRFRNGGNRYGTCAAAGAQCCIAEVRTPLIILSHTNCAGDQVVWQCGVRSHSHYIHNVR